MQSLNLNRIAESSIVDTKEDYAILNAEQLAAGKRADGTDTAPYYAPITVAIKRATGRGLGAVTDRVTLFNTGSFYRGITVDVRGEVVQTSSTDYKSQELEEKYGDIFGLSQRFKQEYVEEYLRPVWKTKMQDATGLKMGL